MTTIPILRDTVRIVMQKVPKDTSYDDVMEALLTVKVTNIITLDGDLFNTQNYREYTEYMI